MSGVASNAVSDSGYKIAAIEPTWKAAEIVPGPDGNLWFDFRSRHALGRVTPTGLTAAVWRAGTARP